MSSAAYKSGEPITGPEEASSIRQSGSPEPSRLREALTYYAEGRYPDGGEIAREALLAWECAKCGEAIHDLPLGRPHDCRSHWPDEPDCHEGNLGANIAGGRYPSAAQDRLAAEYDRERAAVLSTAVGIARQRLREGDAEGARITLDSAAARSTEMLREYLVAYGKNPAEVDALLAVTGADRG